MCVRLLLTFLISNPDLFISTAHFASNWHCNVRSVRVLSHRHATVHAIAICLCLSHQQAIAPNSLSCGQRLQRALAVSSPIDGNTLTLIPDMNEWSMQLHLSLHHCTRHPTKLRTKVFLPVPSIIPGIASTDHFNFKIQSVIEPSQPSGVENFKDLPPSEQETFSSFQS